MPTNKAVVDVVEQWSGQRPEKMSQGLEDWWNQTAPGSSHSALVFNPDGIEDLLKRLQKAFPAGVRGFWRCWGRQVYTRPRRCAAAGHGGRCQRLDGRPPETIVPQIGSQACCAG
jgi:hypothetical protein